MPQAANPSGGANIFRLIALGTTNANLVKAAPGRIMGWHIHNTSAAIKFVKLYDTAVAPTAGAGTPIITISLSPSNKSELNIPPGISFAAGLGFTITGAAVDADATAVTAGDVIVNLFYR